MKQLLLIIALFLGGQAINAQTFTGSGGAIPDNNTVATFPLTVSGLSPATIDTTFGLERVCLNITHNATSDLEVILQAPDGTRIILFSAVGGRSRNFTNTCLNENAAASISSGTGPFTGSYRPQGILANVNNGQTGNGTWRLLVRDMNRTTAGSLVNFSLTFSSSPAKIGIFLSSNLPIIKINTNNQTIVDEPKIVADFVIIDNGPGARNPVNSTTYAYSGKIGIEYRGSSSQGFPKKSYGFETRTTTGLIDSSVSLMGLSKETDWILNANYSDKTLMRNAIAYHISRKMGWWASHAIPVEVFVNNEYLGVFLFMEKIKRDGGRVPVDQITPFDNGGVNVTGGYIIKIDKPTGTQSGNSWNSAYAPMSAGNGQVITYQPSYPDPAEITPAQKNYIKTWVDSFERALAGGNFQDSIYGWRKWADEASFIDYFILNEVARNVDGYRISTYLYKYRQTTKDGKLYCGPVWDYDISFYNANYCNGSNISGWAYNFGTVCPTDGNQIPFWWNRFLQDTAFVTHLKCRYERLRQGYLSNAYLNSWIDTMALKLDEGKTRNFQRWPILGTYVWPNPTPIPADYPAEIARLKSWFSQRLTWMDANMPGTCWGIPLATKQVEDQKLIMFPNPANSLLNFRNTIPIKCIRILDLSGKIVQAEFPNEANYTMNIEGLAKGVYLISVDGEFHKLIIQ